MRVTSTFRFRSAGAWVCTLIALCFPIAPRGAVAQRTASTSHQAWSTEEGLPANAVRQIFQSSDGYIWLATEGGAARFDGVSFTTFTHENEPAFAGNDVSAIAEDKAGNLWFGTGDGLVERHEGTFRTISDRDGLPAGAVISLAAPKDGSLLVLTARGVSRFDGQHFSSVADLPSDVTGLNTASDGSVWLISESQLLKYVSPGFVQSQLVAPGEPLIAVQSLGAGGVLACSSRSVLEIKKNGTTRRLQAGGELPGRITALQIERRGTLAVGTSHGLYLLDGNQETKPNQVDALRGESIASLLEDREGNLWVGTEGSGIHILRPRTFRAEAAAAGEAVTTVSVASDGVPWFGTKSEGVHTIWNGALQTPVSSASLTSPVILSLAPGQHGDVWAGTPDGLNHLDGKSVRQLTSVDGLPDDFVRSVLVDTKGTVWAGTRRGLARIDGEKIATLTSADGLGSDSIGPLLEVHAVHGDDAGFWVGTSVGLSHLRGARFESFSPEANTTSGIVTAMAGGSAHGVWVGLHQNGLSFFDGRRFAKIISSSLPSEIVGIVVDRQKFVWLRGVRSIYRVSESDLLTCAEGKPCQPAIAAYNSVDAMPSDTIAAAGTPALWLAGNSELWVATRTGLAVADTSQVDFNATPPPVVVERLRVDDQNLALGPGSVQIEPGHNRYVFDFAALSFTAPSKNRYRYMLDGFDRDWVEAGAIRTASYTNLPARDYVFRVQAANNDGVWNRIGTSVEFRVLPPFYRRWWFYLVALLVTAGIVFAIYRIRVLNIERRFTLVLNERNRVAREVHDTLAQDFVSVTLQLDLASAMLKAKQYDETGSQLQATRKLVKEGLEDARQSIWNLRANAIADSLPTRLTNLMKRYADSSFHPRLKMGGAYRTAAQQIEDEVFRIAQESLSNIDRHAKATEARVDLFYEHTALRLNIKDNGLGFSTETAKHLQGHYGLSGMQERAAGIGGTFTIQSEPGGGTSVTLLVPLPEREGARI